jgi:hypothetical protein
MMCEDLQVTHNPIYYNRCNQPTLRRVMHSRGRIKFCKYQRNGRTHTKSHREENIALLQKIEEE